MCYSIGVLFEPLMRPVFNVPGEGAFALSMGLAAGYPMDAVITGRFRRQNLCTRAEGERMLAFTNTADPLFIFGAVAVGMFGMPWLGAKLALAHYLGALAVGLLFRFYGHTDVSPRHETARQGNLVARAVDRLVQARAEDGRGLGQLLGDAVNDSIKTLLMICGFIMLFSTFVRIIEVIGLYRLLAAPVATVFSALGLGADLIPSVLSGLLEIDLGTVAAAGAGSPLVQRALMASAIIAWSGLSVHGQVASVLAGTDIRMGPYVVARLLHAVFAAIFTLPLLSRAAGDAAALPVFGLAPATPSFWVHLGHAGLVAVAIPLALLTVATTALAITGGVRWAGFFVRRV